MSEKSIPKEKSAQEPLSVDSIQVDPQAPAGQTEVSTGLAVVAASHHLNGWRLHFTTAGILMCLFLTNLEISIVSTSLVKITNDLQGFSKTSWIVDGYLITYTAFIIIWAKFSDILGRKFTINLAASVFVLFSAGCGASQTMNQLIICRTFQGIGAAGTYSLAALFVYEIVPKEKYPTYGGLVAIVISCATFSGPLFGGLISDKGSWRWIFFLNLPAGILSIALLILGVPNRFPEHTQVSDIQPHHEQRQMKDRLQRIDYMGAGLLLTASLSLVAVLLEAAIRFPWKSAFSIVLLILCVASWLGFLVWERHITPEGHKQEPVFPWRFLKSRSWMGMLLVTFLVGFPYNVVVINLPQRLQAVSGMSPIGAGLRLMPYTFSGSLAALAANITAGKTKMPLVYFFLFGAMLQVLGLGLLSRLPISDSVPAALYGYEILTGVGFGVTFAISMLGTPFVVEKRDLAVATGAIIQFRFLGGAIGLAIATSVMNSALKSKLKSVLPSAQLAELLESIDVIATLEPTTSHVVKQVFAGNYNLQMKIVAGIAAGQLPAAALMWRNGAQTKAE